MKIKVCGMKYPDNINELATLPIDMIGLIFYPKSPRFVDSLSCQSLPNIKKVGVFVNANQNDIIDIAFRYGLDYIQLHGNESPEVCRALRSVGIVIKAFSISVSADFEQTKEYDSVCDYFLFDTKTPYYGGSGQKFDWNILDSYKGNVPFLLSGGISPNDARSITSISHPQFEGIDLNSRFEVEPGRKNVELLRKFITEIRNEQD